MIMHEIVVTQKEPHVCLLDWNSKNHPIVTLSSTKDEFVTTMNSLMCLSITVTSKHSSQAWSN